jgi:4-aminobutyrate aminotransferase-like enzyme
MLEEGGAGGAGGADAAAEPVAEAAAEDKEEERTSLLWRLRAEALSVATSLVAHAQATSGSADAAPPGLSPGCAAALASLDLLEATPECYEGMEARMKPGLVALAAHPRVHRPRQLGCAAAFDLKVEEPGYLNGAGRRLQQLVQQQGVFLRPLGSVVYLFPPLSTTDEQLDQCFKAIAQALDQL